MHKHNKHITKRGDAGSFVNPGPYNKTQAYSENLVWPLGSAQNIRWRWTASSWPYTIWLYQNNVDGNGYAVHATQASDLSRTDFNWTIDLTNYLSFKSEMPQVYYFGLVYENGTTTNVQDDKTFKSKYFNITRPISSSASISITASTTTSTLRSASIFSSLTSSAQVSASTTFSPTANIQSTPSSTSTPNLSHTLNVAPIALGISLGLAIVILVSMLMGLALLKARRANNSLDKMMTTTLDSEDDVRLELPGTVFHEVPGQFMRPVELACVFKPEEMPCARSAEEME